MKVLFAWRNTVLALLGLQLVVHVAAQTALPGWWVNGVLDTSPANPADNWAMANIGQLKNIATQGKAHLDTTLNLTPADWTAAYAPDACPLPFSTAGDPDNFSPVTIGQLKFVAAGFYRLLQGKASGYDVRVRLQALGVPAASISGTGPYFPWAAVAPSAENYSPATIGQLKIVFAFDVTDANHNGIPDIWENGAFGHLVNDPLTDTYSDGLTLIVKYLAGGNPAVPAQVVASSTAIDLKILTP